MIARGGEKMNRAGWELKKNFPAETQSRGHKYLAKASRKGFYFLVSAKAGDVFGAKVH